MGYTANNMFEKETSFINNVSRKSIQHANSDSIESKDDITEDVIAVGDTETAADIDNVNTLVDSSTLSRLVETPGKTAKKRSIKVLWRVLFCILLRNFLH